jgi:hypothetical protein
MCGQLASNVARVDPRLLAVCACVCVCCCESVMCRQRSAVAVVSKAKGVCLASSVYLYGCSVEISSIV